MSARDFIKSFKFHNIILSSDAFGVLDRSLKGLSKSEANTLVGKVIEKIEREHLQNGQLPGPYLESLVKSIQDIEVTGQVDLVFYVELENYPLLRYNLALKSFEVRHDAPKLLGNANSKFRMYADRYIMVKQRVLRSSLFSTGSGKNPNKLASLETLNGTDGMQFIFGFLAQLKEGEYYLEDSNSQVKLDLSQLSADNVSLGLFIEGCLVVCRGIVRDNSFVIEKLSMPISEKREDTGIDFFGCHLSQKMALTLEEWENSREYAYVYILSDLWLDSPSIVNSLKLMLTKLSDNGVIPEAMILCGNFLSREFGLLPTDYETVKGNFRLLAEIIAEHPRIAAMTHFFIVPGHSDTGIPTFPYQPISKVFREPLIDIVKHITFATNPCRLRIGSKTFLVYRDNLVNTMRRNCILPPSDRDNSHSLHEHVVATIVCQSHLNPHIDKPILWEYDHAMQLYPLPDVVILADQYENYQLSFESCQFLNPGSFNIDTSFIQYDVKSGEAEFLSITGES